MRSVTVLPLAGVDLDRFMAEMDAAIKSRAWLVIDGDGKAQDSLESLVTRDELAKQDISFSAGPSGVSGSAEGSSDELGRLQYRIISRVSLQRVLDAHDTRTSDGTFATLTSADASILLLPGFAGDGGDEDARQPGWRAQLKKLLSFAHDRFRFGHSISKAITILGPSSADEWAAAAGIPDGICAELDVTYRGSSAEEGALGAGVLDGAAGAVQRSLTDQKKEKRRKAPIEIAIISALALLVIGAALAVLLPGGSVRDIKVEERVEAVIDRMKEDVHCADYEAVVSRALALMPQIPIDNELRNEITSELSEYAGRALNGLLKTGADGAPLEMDDYDAIVRHLKPVLELLPTVDTRAMTDALLARVEADYELTPNLRVSELEMRRDSIVRIAGGLLGNSRQDAASRARLRTVFGSIYSGVMRRFAVLRIRAAFGKRNEDGPGATYVLLHGLLKRCREWPCAPLALDPAVDAELEAAQGFVGAIQADPLNVRAKLREIVIRGSENDLDSLCGKEADLMVSIESRPHGTSGEWSVVKNLAGAEYGDYGVNLDYEKHSGSVYLLHGIIPADAEAGFTWDIPWMPGTAIRLRAMDSEPLRKDDLITISTEDRSGFAESEYWLPDLGLGLLYYLGSPDGIGISTAARPISPGDANQPKTLARLTLRFEITHQGTPYLGSVPKLLLEARP